MGEKSKRDCGGIVRETSQRRKDGLRRGFWGRLGCGGRERILDRNCRRRNLEAGPSRRGGGDCGGMGGNLLLLLLLSRVVLGGWVEGLLLGMLVWRLWLVILVRLAVVVVLVRLFHGFPLREVDNETCIRIQELGDWKIMIYIHRIRSSWSVCNQARDSSRSEVRLFMSQNRLWYTVVYHSAPPR